MFTVCTAPLFSYPAMFIAASVQINSLSLSHCHCHCHRDSYPNHSGDATLVLYSKKFPFKAAGGLTSLPRVPLMNILKFSTVHLPP